MSSLAPPAQIPAEVFSAWSCLAGGQLSPLGTGLINETFLVVGSGRPLVVQRLHPSFDAKVNVDLDTITALLQRKGLVTPTLVKTDAGDYATTDNSGHVWRAQTYVAGTAYDRLTSPEHAFSAGALVGQFHLALAGEDINYEKPPRHVHQTESHIRFLEHTLQSNQDDPRYDEVMPLADAIFSAASPLPDFDALPLRHCHGDLKCSNLLFDDKHRGICLVDLDTLAPMRWPHEMGDALRSWCNRSGEDHDDVKFDLATLKGAIVGYASSARAFVTPDERHLLVEGIRIICVELAARFLADVINASYFGWNPDRFPTRSDHNLVRARGQFSLARDLERQQAAAEAIVAGAFR